MIDRLTFVGQLNVGLMSLSLSPSFGLSLLATGVGATVCIWILQKKKEVISNAEEKEHSEA